MKLSLTFHPTNTTSVHTFTFEPSEPTVELLNSLQGELEKCGGLSADAAERAIRLGDLASAEGHLRNARKCYTDADWIANVLQEAGLV